MYNFFFFVHINTPSIYYIAEILIGELNYCRSCGWCWNPYTRKSYRPTYLSLIIPRLYFCYGYLLLLVLFVNVGAVVWAFLQLGELCIGHQFETEFFVWFIMRAFYWLISVYTHTSFLFGFAYGIWDVILLVTDLYIVGTYRDSLHRYYLIYRLPCQ